MSEIKQVTDWIDAAGQEPSVRNVAMYFALVLEEIGEGLKAVAGRDVYLNEMHDEIKHLSRTIRRGEYDREFEAADKLELLDSAMDCAWVSIGMGYMLADAQGAFAEVANSNHSKFENGVCELDATGKVVKGPSYFKPDLAKYLRG